MVQRISIQENGFSGFRESVNTFMSDCHALNNQFKATMEKTLTTMEFMKQSGSEDSCETFLAHQKWG